MKTARPEPGQTLTFEPAADDPTPLAQQLADFVHARVQSGDLASGTALPPAGDWPAVGRVTVLQAYRRLRDEGVVSMLPYRGTVIRPQTKRQRCAIILPAVEVDAYSAFELQIQVEVMNLFVEAGMALALYPLTRHMPLGRGEDRRVPKDLSRDAAAGLVAGAVVRPSAEFPGFIEWLRKRGIPMVSMRDVPSLDVPHVRMDQGVMLEQGLRHLAGLGHRRILLLAGENVPAPELPGLAVIRRRFKTNLRESTLPGRRLAGEWQKPVAAGEFDAVCITDDWVALGFLLEMRACGVRLPGAAAMLVACNTGQLEGAFMDCERMVLSTRKIAEKILDLYRFATTRGSPPVDPCVTHTIIPAEGNGTAGH
jgi:DNA-binding LacI/PurR family transcriptional regulator